MQQKPAGLVSLIAWATLAIGLYMVSASLFGVVYLILSGKGAVVLEYVRPILFGGVLATAGGGLLLGRAWSRFVFLGICILSLASLYQFLPVLLLFGHIGDSGLRASLFSMFWTLLFSLKWPIAACVSTYFVFRHFRLAKSVSGPTLAEMTLKS